MDKVGLEDESERYVQVDLEGPGAGDALLGLGFPNAPDPDGVVKIEGVEEALIAAAAGQRGLSGSGYRLLVPSDSWEEIWGGWRVRG